MTHLRQGLGLDLTDALPGHVEMPSYLVEGGRPSDFQAVAHLDDGALTIGEALQDELKVLDVELGGDQLERRSGLEVLDEITEHGVVVTDRLEDRNRFGGDLSRLTNLVDRQTRLLGELVVGRLAAEALGQVGLEVCICVMVSIMWTGTRMVRLLSAMARVIA